MKKWMTIIICMVLSGCCGMDDTMGTVGKITESEKLDGEEERSIHLDKATVPIKKGEVEGTAEGISQDHIEITENPITKDSLSYCVYEKKYRDDRNAGWY